MSDKPAAAGAGAVPQEPRCAECNHPVSSHLRRGYCEEPSTSGHKGLHCSCTLRDMERRIRVDTGQHWDEPGAPSLVHPPPTLTRAPQRSARDLIAEWRATAKRLDAMPKHGSEELEMGDCAAATTYEHCANELEKFNESRSPDGDGPPMKKDARGLDFAIPPFSDSDSKRSGTTPEGLDTGVQSAGGSAQAPMLETRHVHESAAGSEPADSHSSTAGAPSRTRAPQQAPSVECEHVAVAGPATSPRDALIPSVPNGGDSGHPIARTRAPHLTLQDEKDLRWAINNAFPHIDGKRLHLLSLLDNCYTDYELLSDDYKQLSLDVAALRERLREAERVSEARQANAQDFFDALTQLRTAVSLQVENLEKHLAVCQQDCEIVGRVAARLRDTTGADTKEQP